ncbi:hypothetical protein [Gordonia sp. NB41Y]|uniref:hypothetical protein n=1 Tax=Gordonia sp. NB41Y TaxID=875808 RepID=UPI0002BFB56F|nr:hypothetical protein [Gordonia sp. NB41Y]EMP13513.1 hypothetical protein ISGA_347 [Gordonia sp. NB41Y]WLP91444.1 hypothetical protein Q9K23_04040 [Gordonia sp. NB41Y]
MSTPTDPTAAALRSMSVAELTVLRDHLVGLLAAVTAPGFRSWAQAQASAVLDELEHRTITAAADEIERAELDAELADREVEITREVWREQGLISTPTTAPDTSDLPRWSEISTSGDSVDGSE